MRKIENQIKRMAALASVVLMATAEAWAQERTNQERTNQERTNQGRTGRRIVVSIADRKLAVIEGEQVIRIFEIAVGAPASPSPTGVFKVANSIADPTWYGKGKVVGPGKNNPIGTRWLGLSLKDFGIHGTNAPSSIGHNQSHGCIRMRNHEVEELFKMVGVGDQVELYAERNPELEQIFGRVMVARTGCPMPDGGGRMPVSAVSDAAQ
jgi:lipoprotein-anchoring transpeptidase ErfK/SrfK